jgi:hypothetical protein
MIPIKAYDNMNNLKMTMSILNMSLNFTFVSNPKTFTSVIVQTVHLFMFSPFKVFVLGFKFKV